MPAKYQVFCDHFTGMAWCTDLCADTLEEAVGNIYDGVLGSDEASPHWMYYIYVLHAKKVPYWGCKVDVYRHVKAVGGRLVSPFVKHREGLLYALTNWEANWLFADKLAGPLFDDYPLVPQIPPQNKSPLPG